MRPSSKGNVAPSSGPRPTNSSWRVDKTYIKVKGAWMWMYLYRAVDSTVYWRNSGVSGVHAQSHS